MEGVDLTINKLTIEEAKNDNIQALTEKTGRVFYYDNMWRHYLDVTLDRIYSNGGWIDKIQDSSGHIEHRIVNFNFFYSD